MRTARPLNFTGLVVAGVLLLSLLAIIPAVIIQSRFLLAIELTLSGLEKTRMASYEAFRNEPRPETAIEVTQEAADRRVIPTIWLRRGRIITPAGGQVELVKSAEDGVKVMTLTVQQVPTKACTALLWRLSSKEFYRRWLHITADGEQVAPALSPAESRQHCHDLTDISLGYRY